MPVVGAGSVNQEIVQTIDPQKLVLTSADDIVYPTGWTLSVSTDGTAFTTTLPTSVSGWAAVRAVKASGTVVSQGVSNGSQIASGTSTKTMFPPAGYFDTISPGLDPWTVAFDDDGRIFTQVHHKYGFNGGASIKCRIRDGSACPGWSSDYFVGVTTTDTTDFGSPFSAYVWVDMVNNRLWYPTWGATWRGFGCVSVAPGVAPGPCTTAGLTSSYISFGSYTNPNSGTYDLMQGLTENSGKIYSFDVTTGNVVCANISTPPLGPCTGGSWSSGSSSVANFSNQYPGPSSVVAYWGVSLRVISGKLWVLARASGTSSARLACLEPSTGAYCSGWSPTVGSINGTIDASTNVATGPVALPGSSGQVVAICARGGAWSCFTPAGATYPVPTNFSANVSMRGQQNREPQTYGTKIYSSNGNANIWCYDASTDSACAGFIRPSARFGTFDHYTFVEDPLNPGCIWFAADTNGRVGTIDSITGGNCTASPSSLVFGVETIVPRLGCSAADAIAQWGTFTVTAPPSSAYSGATVDVVNNGLVVATYNVVNGSADLSNLSVSSSGASPVFRVKFATLSGAPTTGTASITVIGDSPQLCLHPDVVVNCPVGTGVLTGLSASSTTVSAAGSSVDGSSNVTNMTPASVNLSVAAPGQSDCGGTLTGRAGTATLGTTGDALVGATVTLLDSAGTVITNNGSPVTTTTDGSGNYSFGYLFPGNYKVRFPDSGTTSAVATAALSSVTVATGGTGTVSASTQCVAGWTFDATSSTCSRTITSTIANVGAPVGVTLSYLVVGGGGGGAPYTTNALTRGGAGGQVVAGSASVSGTVGVTIGAGGTAGVAGGSSFISGGVIASASGGAGGGGANPASSGIASSISGASVFYGADGANWAGTAGSGALASGTANRGNGGGAGSRQYEGAGCYEPGAGHVFLNPGGPCGTGGTYENGGWSTINAAGAGGSGVVILRYPVQVISNASTVPVGGGAVVNGLYIASAIARPNIGSGAQGSVQTISVLADDTASSGASYSGGSTALKICGATETSPGCTGTSRSITGQGTYAVSGTNITFTPCSANNVPAGIGCTAAFTGTATPIAYQSTDSLGRVATSTVTPTVVPLPSAVADAQTGAWDTNQTYNPTANDSAGSGATLVSAPSGICASTVTAVASCTSTTLTIANQGTYTLNTTTGAVTFDPVSTFSGTATPIKYAVVDSLGQKVLSTITPTVLPPPAPTGNPDTTTGKVGQAQIVNPVSNDTTSAGTFTASTVRLCSTGQTPPNCTATSLVVSGQGSYSVNTSSGVITFTPCSGVNTPVMTPSCTAAFTGTATPVTYQVSTSMSQVASSTYTPRVAPFPTAVADAQTGPWDTNQVYSPTANDTAGSGASLVAVPSGICVNSTTDPALCTSNSLTISNQGTYTLNTTTGTVTFDPLPAFTGPATPIKYAVADNFGQKSLATITPTVTPPAAPTANPQSKTVIPGGIATFTTLTGAGGLASTGGPAFNNAATCLIAPAAPATCATSVSVAGEGTWSVNTGTGVVTFTANSGVTSGTKTPVTYRVTDSTGQTATSTLTPIVPPPPTANPDSSVDEQNETQVLSPLSNDSAASSTSLNPSSVKLCPTNVSAPYNGTNCNLSSLSIADVGKFTVNSDGTVTFVPCTAVAGVTCAGSYVGGSNVFTGTATARYVVADDVGQFGSSTLSAQALPPPAVKPSNDSGTSPFATSVVFDPLANDSGGTTTGPSMSAYSSVGTASPDPGTLRLCGSGESAPVCAATSVNKPEGTYVLDQATGRITFTPAPNYVGTPDAPPLYMVCNQMGGTWAPLTPSTSCSTAKLTPTIQPPSSPTATNDAQTGPYNTPLIISVLGNDTKDPALTISGSTVKLCASAQTAPNCTATTLSSPGEGTYTVNPATGQVTFTPESSFAGTPTLRPGYQFTDSYGATASAIITPTITAPPAPTASPQTKRVLPGTSVNFTNVIGASALATGTGLRAGTLGGPCLVDPADTVCKTSFTIAGQGDWSIDQATGVPTFVADPAASVGTKTAVTFRVTDAVGTTATAALTPVVPPDPTVTPDSGSAGLDTNQTFSVLVNDNPGTGTTFDVTSVRLCGNGETPPNCSATTLVVANQGTYSVSSTGVVTFDPLPDFAGAATPVSYQVTDSMGRTVNTTVSATVTAVPPTPSADTVLVPRGGSRSFEPIHGTGGLVTRNTGGAPLTTSTTCIIDPATSICGTTSVVIAGEGVYSVDVASGVVTFTADPSASDGPLTAVSYEITDAAGNTVGSTLTPTVVPPPTAQADLSSGVQGESQVIQVLFNDAPGDPAQPLTPSTVRICATTETSPACTRSTLTIAGEGTYVVQTDGRVVFTPVPAFVGTGTLLAYTVEDSIGQKAASTLRVAVTATNSEPANPAAPSNPGSAPPNQPTVLDQVTSTRPLTPVYLRPTLDGSASPNATFDFSRVELWDEARGIWTTSIDNEQGRWTVVGELVEFVPKAGFTGVADVRFRVPDSTGQMASASLTVTVAPGELPRTGAGFLVLMWWALVVVLFGARLSRSTLARHAT